MLRSFDVGEADRFCIVLTRELGRLPVRVAGARKTGSRLGGSVLALRRVHLDIHDGDTGAVVRAATVVAVPEALGAAGLATLQLAAETVLRLTEDRQELPELFEACAAFFAAPPERQNIRAFTATALHLLGVLPLSPEDRRFAALPSPARAWLAASVGDPLAAPPPPAAARDIDAFLASVLDDHLTAPLVVPPIRAALA